MASERLDTDREVERLNRNFRRRTLQQTSGNTSSPRRAQVSEYCSKDNTDSQHNEADSHAAQNSPYPTEPSQPAKTGYEGIDTFDHGQWRAMLEQLPGIYWQGNDPWYLADVYDKESKKWFKRWERVPIIRPEERERYDQSKHDRNLYNKQLPDQTRYGVYKKRKRKDLSKNKDYVVWPAHIERAFEIACICIPPILGKKKVPVRQRDGSMKPCGRNELIARKIFDLTGAVRDRKQISSHIQVIKKFLEVDGNTFLDAVKTDLAKVEAADLKAVRYDLVEGRLVVGDPVPITVPKMEDFSANEQSTASALVQSISFSMRLQMSRMETLHTCTTMQSERGAQKRPLDDELKRHFPDLGQCLTDGLAKTCEVILFESSISLIEDRPPPGAKLAIYYAIDFTSNQKQSYWRFRTTRYEDSGKFNGQRLSPEVNKPRLQIEELGKDRFRLREAPLMSGWWVDIFTKAADRRRRVQEEGIRKLEKLGHGPCECETCLWIQEEAQKASLAEEVDIRRELQGMSFMQEVFGEDGRERVAIFLWKFRPAQPGETATTTWRRVPRASATNIRHHAPDASVDLSAKLTSDQTYYTTLAEDNKFGEISNGILGWDSDWQPELAVENAEHHPLGDEVTATIAQRVQARINLESQSWNPHYYQMFSNPSAPSRFNSPGETESVMVAADEDHGNQSTLESYCQQSFADPIGTGQPDESEYHGGLTENTVSQLGDFDFGGVTDSNLMSDFHGGHIRINSSQATESMETLNYTANDEAALQTVAESHEHEHEHEHSQQSGRQLQGSPVLHAPQPRRLVSPLPLLSPTEQIHSTEGTTPDLGSLSVALLHTQELCADANVLSGLASQSGNLVYQFPFMSCATRANSQHLDYHQPTLHVIPSSNSEVPMSYEPETSHDRNYGMDLQTSTYELHSSLLASSHPHADTNTNTEDTTVIDPELEASQHSTQDTQTTSESTDTALSLVPEDDNSWVCDIAIAQLEGWIEHANAMEEELAGATREPSDAIVVEIPSVEAALERSDATEDEAERPIGQGKVIGAIEDEYEVSIKEEALDDNDYNIEDDAGEGFVLVGNSPKEGWEGLGDEESGEQESLRAL